jgi:hypothetical protein
MPFGFDVVEEHQEEARKLRKTLFLLVVVVRKDGLGREFLCCWEKYTPDLHLHIFLRRG